MTTDKTFVRKGFNFLFPDAAAERRLSLTFFVCIAIKLLVFNTIWCSNSTFAAFSTFEFYLYNALALSILLIPLVCFRAVRITLVVMLSLDLLFVANLMYFRTYFSAIPFYSHGIADNLQDFKASVYASLRAVDLIFPLTTLLPLIVWRKYFSVPRTPVDAAAVGKACSYLICIGLLCIASGIYLYTKKGFKNAYDSHLRSSLFSCRTPMYTLFGSLWYDYLTGNAEFTPEIRNQIDSWLAAQAGYAGSPLQIEKGRANCILILAESLESWVVETTFDGQEITPCLNSLLRDSNTVYVPRVQSQVKGGRSIDAQLMINTGLLPIASGSFSVRYPTNAWPGLATAFRQQHPDARTYSATVDKKVVWNQQVIAPAFGYDALLDKDSFVAEEVAGPQKKVGDASFLRQIGEKIESGEIWSDSGHNLLQLVTYSGHHPFKLPEELRKTSFSTSMPEMMKDYMYTANYTDYAIGQFIQQLKRQGRYENTLIVITGDHEGLADHRESLAQSEAGRGIVCPQQFVPLIVVNAPMGKRYEEVMGQIDIYPTLLDLMGLSQYPWRGMGVSIFHPGKTPYAIDPHMNMIGVAPAAEDRKPEHLKESWTVGDYIIRYDYLKDILPGWAWVRYGETSSKL
ncbi:MAG: LTA synthase family protein [Bacteroides sp.]|nr:LTA synthase family protein [Bacteroides sp.]